MSDWWEQYHRMKRWRRQLDTLIQRRTERADAHIEQLRDLFFAFFQTCDHMQDWLANDAWNPMSRAEVEAYVHTSPALSVCRDLCNGSKHARLDAKRVDLREDHKITNVQTIYTGDEEIAKMLHLEPTLTLIYRGEPVDPFDLADRCVAAWDSFLAQHSLDHLVSFRDDERW
jgi:hypothetical protein